MATVSLDELMMRESLSTNDPVERHIILHLQRLQHQNKRLRDHIAKTGAWASLKDVDLWKPFDFFHYFTTKYQDRYGRAYRNIGNIVATYQTIDEFRLGNHITKKNFKKFIDLAFEKHFNNINVPRVAHICSPRLYNHLMTDTVETRTADQYRSLDRALIKEYEAFEQHVRDFNQPEVVRGQERI